MVGELKVDKTNSGIINRVLTTNLDDFIEIAKALSTDIRVNIFKQLIKGSMNVNEISEMFEIPPSTAAVNIKKLEEAKLIKTELIPGTRGTQKVCAAVYSRIIVEMEEGLESKNNENFVLTPMPIGHFFDSKVAPTCGLLNEEGIIGEFDDPGSFFDPNRVSAKLIWFCKGFVEYRFPKQAPHGTTITNLEFTMEICSEAPLHNLNWPSDITMWINGVEIGTWTSPGDFGGERGVLTPSWWGTENSQFGLLKTWRVNNEGTFIDGRKISNCQLKDLNLLSQSYISMRIGLKEDALNNGGINLFGKGFGNYDTDIVMRLDYIQN
ncbi:helix-turn-helix domain-containing protein [Pullulanibacillus sp. KACC 23026]|uniref:ArsR/SmtB family transcription factor n=1 Tax=Pullulanibacillus sp. KACC 23026 TaxID=3028315 RepID=UPI0023AFDC6A|nr:helix-turn-helix domain-containing protein [Pullulanibacillus sp. KACC 23026]WEG12831.1 helix-turn-helix domain-containing protein [Pullulanibacillus sp. KACC 23026]